MKQCQSCSMPEDSGTLYLVEGQMLCGTCCAVYLRRARTLTATQADDDGLWFQAETAPEAYLQEALRRLHGMIEP